MTWKKRLLLSRIFLGLGMFCVVLTIASLIPTGSSDWGGLPWLLAHVFLAAGVVVLIA